MAGVSSRSEGSSPVSKDPPNVMSIAVVARGVAFALERVGEREAIQK